eukprot:CAMPEP_0182864920 /NCGR_PEP_ID=MMETSP0034_2-20130328/7420_1 /TAXON_ID=156128 /ORGANISM="Nephroselmis pyriformis, Strain CCMP717" /LENGTH=131 /DNA_ID=CAMNT_0024997193 /DNA_START=250 /DNA_END=641 /DNA_ORIENTATION=-
MQTRSPWPSTGLEADVHDFGGSGGPLARYVEGHLGVVHFNQWATRVVGGWFVYTGWKTFSAARAGGYEAHRRWAVRHIASGLWVAFQRPFFSVLRFGSFAVLGKATLNDTTAVADVFYTASAISPILFYLG